jgi:ATP-dependent helicase/nuclease subunit A
VSERDGKLREIRCGDIAILLRSVKDKAPVYAAALAEEGIPCAYESGTTFFDTTEINIMLSLLSVIDNPRQDIPLISAMRSPIYGFTPDELASIRACDRNGDFWDALLSASENDEKCRALQGRSRATARCRPTWRRMS